MISSRSNPLVKRIRALHASRHRAESGQFLAEGPKVVADALAAGLTPVEVAVSPRLDQSAGGAALRAQLVASGVAIVAVTDEVLDALSAAEAHQGVVAVLRRRAATIADVSSAELLLVLHGLRDPGNVGAIIRSAAGFGAGGALVAESADPWGPKAVRASAGALFRLPVVVLQGDLAPVVRELPHRRIAAVARGGRPPSQIDWARPVAILVGAEGAGLSAELRAVADDEVTIPLAGGLESLNVAAAAAVLLHAATGRSVPGCR